MFDYIRTAVLKLRPNVTSVKEKLLFLDVLSDGIKNDLDKVRAIKTWPVPLNVKELHISLT